MKYFIWIFEGFVPPIFVFVALLLGLLMGSRISREMEHDKAVDVGVGHYVCDPKTGATHFEFINPSETPNSSEEQASDGE